MTHSSLRSWAALAALAVTAPLAQLEATGPWSARLRGTYLEMADRSNAFSALGINFAADSVGVNSKWIPEVDVSYAFSENVSAELVLTVPQTQDVTLAGVGRLGSFKHLPPTLLVQYQLSPGAVIRPYVGAGVNFTLIFDTNLSVAGVPLDLERASLGLAAQAGFDVKLGRGLALNFDAKRAALRSDVSVQGGPRLTTAKLDPWLFSVGLGWRF